MVEKYRIDKRTKCPDCGSTEFQIQVIGAVPYIVCDDGCEDSILGEIDPWDDRIAPN